LKLLKDSQLAQITGNSRQAIELAARIDAYQRRKDRKFRKFPVILPVLREIEKPRSGMPPPEEMPMTETPAPSITTQPGPRPGEA
jgi:hypothetical protein